MSIAVLTLATAPAGGGNPLTALGLPILIFVIFYFVLFAPMRKRQKALQKIVEELKRGDSIITSGGLYGDVVAVEGTSVLLKIADGVKVRVAKANVAGLQAEDNAGEKK